MSIANILKVAGTVAAVAAVSYSGYRAYKSFTTYAETVARNALSVQRMQTELDLLKAATEENTQRERECGVRLDKLAEADLENQTYIEEVNSQLNVIRSDIEEVSSKKHQPKPKPQRQRQRPIYPINGDTEE